ncbi:MAG TPA: hypothetical protein VJP77_03900 [Planctomycetota bacterium]|nr:hypothetical protein [Planctomycetota bacterium]
MRTPIRTATLAPSWLALLAPLAAAQVTPPTVHLYPGDDLPVAVALATTSTVFVLHGDATYVGTLDFDGEDHWFVAAPGDAPTLRGDVGEPAVDLTSTMPPSSAHCVDLRLRPGEPAGGFGPPPAVRLGGNGSLVYASVSLEDCTVEGDVVDSGTGFHSSEVVLRDTDVQGRLLLSGTGQALCFASVLEGSAVDAVVVSGTGSAANFLDLEDSEVRQELRVLPALTAIASVLVDRARLTGPLEVEPQATAIASVHVSNSLVLGDGTGTGILVRDAQLFVASNLTVAGFERGIDAELPAEFRNLLVFDNDQDVAPGMLASQFASSLIEGGAFAGKFHNFGGTPFVDDAYALLGGSLGIDQGDDGLAVGGHDVYFESRIQDGDGDGNARVNVGAVEGLGECPTAKVKPFDGSGVNPEFYAAATKPVLGQVYVGVVSTGADTVATLIAVGAGAPLPFAVPGVEGEVLLALAPAPMLDFAAGTHVLAVPDDQTLCGGVVDTQAFRIDLVGPVVTAVAGNGLRLVLGE